MCWDQSWWPENPPSAFISPSLQCTGAGWVDIRAAPSTTSLAKVGDPRLEAAGSWFSPIHAKCLHRSPLPQPLALRGGSALLPVGLCSLPGPTAHASQLASHHSSGKMKASSYRYFALLILLGLA